MLKDSYSSLDFFSAIMSSRSSFDEAMTERRSYLPPLRAPYDTDYNYINSGRLSQSLPAGNQQYFSSDRMSRNSSDRPPIDYPQQNSNDKLFFEELLRRQQRWVMGVMESSFRRISDDIVKTSNVIRRHESLLQDINSNYNKLEKYYGAVMTDLTSKAATCDKKIRETYEDLKQNRDNIEKSVIQASQNKKDIEDHIMKNNAEYVMELSKVRAEIEGLRTSYKKDITTADERKRIEMDDARSRIQTLDTYTKNALHTLKNAVQEALGRTENKIADDLKEERMVWRQSLDSATKHEKEQMERLDQSISLIEEESKRLIDAMVKKLENVHDIVTTEKSTNEEFRKVVKNYMDTSKSQSERLTMDLNSVKTDYANKSSEFETNIESLRTLLEGRHRSLSDQIDRENAKLDQRIKELSKQVQTLQQKVIASQTAPDQ